jgi:hypothetical protein
MSYLIRPSDVTPYSPANHTGTRNFRRPISSDPARKK